MTQKLTFAALFLSAATTAGATCIPGGVSQECGNLPNPNTPTTQPITVDVRNAPVTTIGVNPALSNTGTNTLDATVQGTNTLNGAVNGTVNGTNTNAFTPTNTNTGTNTGYVSGTNTNNNNFDPNNTNALNSTNIAGSHSASGVTVGQGALSPTAIGMGGIGGQGGQGGQGGAGGNASSGANAVGVGGNAYSGATGGTGIGGVGMGGAGGESRSTATGVGGNQSQNQGQALDNRNTISATTGDSTSKAITGPAIASTGAVTTGGATANAAPQTQTFAPVSNYTYKEAKNPVNTALAPTLFAAQGGEGMESLGGWSIAAQLVGFGGSGGVNHGTKFSEGWAQFKLTSQALASPNPAVRLFGLTAAAEQHPKTFGVALAGVREAVTSSDPLLGALSDNYRVAAAPATVTVVDNTPKNPCADKPGTTPVWNAARSDFECRNSVYRMK